MATWTITIPDAHAQRVIDAFAVQYNYQETLEDEEGEPYANPESEAEFAKRHVREYIKDVLKAAEATAASEDARLTAIADVEGVEIT